MLTPPASSSISQSGLVPWAGDLRARLGVRSMSTRRDLLSPRCDLFAGARLPEEGGSAAIHSSAGMGYRIWRPSHSQVKRFLGSTMNKIWHVRAVGEVENLRSRSASLISCVA